MEGFIDQLVDWKDFENFVRDRYAEDDGLIVEHDVTEVGKSGAKRQTDVKLTLKRSGLTFVTLIECKRWKDKVSRDRIDVLAAAVDDLNANKGVMFTTSGFEEGAELYARDRGIELFLVRDLTAAEWGLPGRVVSFWWHMYTADILRIEPGAVTLIPIVERPPTNLQVDFLIGPEQVLDPVYVLRSVVDGEDGPNLLALLLDARVRTLNLLSQSVPLFDDASEDAHRRFLVPVVVDLSAYEHRQMMRRFGVLRFAEIRFQLAVDVHQYRFSYDRGAGFDFALAVENYVTHQKEVVARRSEAIGMNIAEMVTGPDPPEDADDAVNENTFLRIFTDAWVRLPESEAAFSACRKVTFRLPEWSASVE